MTQTAFLPLAFSSLSFDVGAGQDGGVSGGEGGDEKRHSFLVCSKKWDNVNDFLLGYTSECWYIQKNFQSAYLGGPIDMRTS
jgi:hypothetical protein